MTSSVRNGYFPDRVRTHPCARLTEGFVLPCWWHGVMILNQKMSSICDILLRCNLNIVLDDAAYLVLPNARSRYAGHFYLSERPPKGDLTSVEPPTNGPIHTECRTIKTVMGSAAEVETAGLYGNTQMGTIIWRALMEIGHPQPPTPIKTDNSTANSFINVNIRQKRSKTWDMWWNWMRDKQTHNQFRFYWDKGSKNEGDYFTKHHPPKHHREQRSNYILKGYHISKTSFDSKSLHRVINMAIQNLPSTAREGGFWPCRESSPYARMTSSSF